MANTGILLRKDYKVNFTDVREGELVFAIGTDEVGMLIRGELYWQNWVNITSSSNYLYTGDNLPDNSLGENSDKYIQTKDVGGSIQLIEFIKETGVWRELQNGVITLDWAEVNLEKNIHDETYPYLGKYTYSMSDGYIPTDNLDIATNGYMGNINIDPNLIRLDGSTPMNSDYIPVLEGDVITPNHLLSGNIEIIVPIVDPDVEGAVWNDNGILRISGN